MHSRRVLGIAALVAVVTSAISFAVVDVAIADANGCLAASACLAGNIPPLAVVFFLVGAGSLLTSIGAGARWFSGLVSESVEADDTYDREPQLG
ncbi:MAG TPA: hypothetical protein VNT53_10710 [Pseudolysinimonas sp.]|nr:hypothetical protein [Pseudolysinimonas sp.]